MSFTTFKNLGLTACATVLLAGCVSGPQLVPAGKFTAGGPSSLTLDRDWSDVTKVFSHHADKVKILSIDGILLNRLYVSDGLAAADPLTVNSLTGDTTEHPSAHGHADMSLSEQMEFVSRSVSVLDYQKVETGNPQPVMVGAVKGIRFEFTARTTEGLNMRGLAQAVSSKGLGYYVVYIAPAEYYYDANLKNAVAAMNSVKLPG